LRIPLRIVFYQEEGSWIAHCLEFDLVGDGETQPEALTSLADAIDLQIEATIEHGNPANLFSPAEGRYFQMFAEGKDLALGELALQPAHGVVIERMESREYLQGDLVPV
jgi:predicted RNase H-like HicB family nuclease